MNGNEEKNSIEFSKFLDVHTPAQNLRQRTSLSKNPPAALPAGEVYANVKMNAIIFILTSRRLMFLNNLSRVQRRVTCSSHTPITKTPTLSND